MVRNALQSSTRQMHAPARLGALISESNLFPGRRNAQVK